MRLDVLVLETMGKCISVGRLTGGFFIIKDHPDVQYSKWRGGPKKTGRPKPNQCIHIYMSIINSKK